MTNHTAPTTTTNDRALRGELCLSLNGGSFCTLDKDHDGDEHVCCGNDGKVRKTWGRAEGH